MSRAKSATYGTSLPFNWAKMTCGERRTYLGDAYNVLDRFEGIVALTDDYVKDDIAASQELRDHFEALKHHALMVCNHLDAQIELCKKDASPYTEDEKQHKDVHTEHCCSQHGCKYGDKDCTVERGIAPQSFSCEYCDE